MSFRPVDDETRRRARDELRKSFVVEAGAGTGKTTLLLDRIENLVRTGAAGLDEIAAVTFTENAATAMKLRLRERLERARADETVPGRQRERAARALDVLERAQVSTIHALCAAILQERPLECGVTPGFEVMDDARTDALFAEAWEQWLSDSLAAGDDLILEAMDHGIPLEAQGRFGKRGSLRGLARALLEQRDLHPLAVETPPELDGVLDLLREITQVDVDWPADQISEMIELAKEVGWPAVRQHVERIATREVKRGSPPKSLRYYIKAIGEDEAAKQRSDAQACVAGLTRGIGGGGRAKSRGRPCSHEPFQPNEPDEPELGQGFEEFKEFGRRLVAGAERGTPHPRS